MWYILTIILNDLLLVVFVDVGDDDGNGIMEVDVETGWDRPVTDTLVSFIAYSVVYGTLS